jgi:16S rRNA processing protein RimM
VKFRELPRSHQGDLLLWPVDCNDRDRAEEFRGTEVSVPRSAFPKLPPGEYYHRDLIGLDVKQVGGDVLGTVVRIESYPTVDVAVVKTATGDLEIPIIDPYWVDADVANRCVIVDHIEHLRALLNSKD